MTFYIRTEHIKSSLHTCNSREDVMQGHQAQESSTSRLYEGIAIVAASVGLALMSGQDLGHSGALAVVASVVAVIWNLSFNALFERWESRQAVRGPQRARAASPMPSASRAAWSRSWCRCWPGGSTSQPLAGAGDGPGPGGVLPGLHLRLQLGLRPRVRPAGLGAGERAAELKIAAPKERCSGSFARQAWDLFATTLACSRNSRR